MQDLSPEALPFDVALRAVPQQNQPMIGALVDVNDTLHLVKCMLLQNRVRNFSAAEVVELARLIIEREAVLASRIDAQ